MLRWLGVLFILLFQGSTGAHALPLEALLDPQIGSVPIFVQGEGRELEQAAEDLLRCFPKCTGLRCHRVDRFVHSGGNLRGIIIGSGWIGSERSDDSNVFLLEGDSFVVVPEKHTLVLSGADSYSSALAVYYFLQQYLGMRWLFPGALGEVFPKEPIAEIADLHVWREPSYYSRGLGLGKGAENDLWALRNYLHVRVVQHHAMYRYFDADLFTRHPEFFPMENGQRRDPAKRNGVYSNPDFGSQDAAIFLSRKLRSLFRCNPEDNGASIAISDDFRLGDSPEASQWTDDAGFFRNRRNFSDLVFSFYNRVARNVAEEFPLKYLSCYAYFQTEAVPSFPVFRTLLPFLTSDRAQYYDEVFRCEDRKLVRDWMLAGPTLIAHYGYLYGGGYWIPRIFMSSMMEGIIEDHNAGVRIFYAEQYPIWPFDGAKAWLAARLLFDVDQDGELLLDEYYRLAYGAGAKWVAAFFERCENLWNAQPGRAWWLKYFKDSFQSSLFSQDDCAQLGVLLERAYLAVPRGSSFAKRIQLLKEAFAVSAGASDLYAQYAGFADCSSGPDSLFQRIQSFCESAAALDNVLLDVADPQGLMANWSSMLAIPFYNPLGPPLDALLSRAAGAGELDLWVDRLLEYRNSGVPCMRYASQMIEGAVLRIVDSNAWRQILKNEDLQAMEWRELPVHGEILLPAHWNVQMLPAEDLEFSFAPGALRWSAGESNEIGQSFLPCPGHLYRAEVEITGQISEPHRAFLFLAFGGPDGRIERRYARVFPTGEVGAASLVFYARAPEWASGGYLGFFSEPQGATSGDFVIVQSFGLEEYSR